MDELDIWLTAALLVERYRTNALGHTAKMVTRMAELGDADRMKAWTRIMRAAAELLRNKLRPGEFVH